MQDAARRELAEQVSAELVRLRRGGGVYDADLQNRLGPHLLELLDYTPGMDEAVIRPELVRLLDLATAPLSPQQRRVALMALGVHPSHGDTALQERMRIVADELGVVPRTVHRRLVEATDVMAGVLADQLLRLRRRNPDAPAGWTVESLDARLSFAEARPELVERREILVTAPGLREIVANVSVMSPNDRRADRLDVTALAGCEVLEIARVGGSYWRVRLGLAKALLLGERHAYEVAFRTPSREAMLPFYAFVPQRPSRRFSAAVTFARAEDVDQIWALDGVPQSVVLDRAPDARDGDVTIGPDNRVTCSYDHPLMGMCYGFQWRWRLGE